MKLTKKLINDEVWVVSNKVSFPWKEIVCIKRQHADKWTMIYVSSGYRIDVVEGVKDVLKLKLSEALTLYSSE